MDQRAYGTVGELYAASYRRLIGVVAVAAGSRADAEECVQDAFVRLIGKWPTVSRYDDPEAWVRTVAFRLLSNHRRRARNRLRALTRQRHEEAVTAPDGSDLSRALGRLSLPHRQVIVLHYLVGLPVAEVAEALGVAPGTVKSRLSRARDVLAPLLREDTTHA